MKTRNNAKGFTLIELLVVVSILAALAGIASVAMDGYQQEAEAQITRVEMQRIANAIRRFKADTGYWPKTESAPYSYDNADNAANFSFLFSQTGTAIPDWTPEYAIGWNGPYIDLPAIRALAFDDVNATPIDCSAADDATIQTLARFDGLIDRFEQTRFSGAGLRYCVVTRKEDNPSEFKIAEFSGSPYLYEEKFTHADSATCQRDTGDPTQSVTCIAVRSYGPDGVNDGGADASDDIVFVLEVNSELGE